jgi:DNA-binding MarR family transcriptional regulator
MADISFEAATSPLVSTEALRRDAAAFDLIELLFFAYRDFVGDADEMLAKFGFGRAHHRVLHFVNRNPGMKVAELLDILKITKQSLGRVLKQLLDEGYVEQKEGATDRRHRLLYVTAKGEALALRLAASQTARIGSALAEIGMDSRETIRRFLIAMLNPDQRGDVLRLIEGVERGRHRRS